VWAEGSKKRPPRKHLKMFEKTPTRLQVLQGFLKVKFANIGKTFCIGKSFHAMEMEGLLWSCSS